jgi:hypothetical protein
MIAQHAPVAAAAVTLEQLPAREAGHGVLERNHRHARRSVVTDPA